MIPEEDNSRGQVAGRHVDSLDQDTPTQDEPAKGVLKSLEQEAQDALDLALAEAPEGSQRERYRFVREHLFPLTHRLEDEGEQGAALDDVAKKLNLRKSDLRKAFAEFEEKIRQQENTEDEAEGEEELIPEPGSKRYERAMEMLKDPDILEKLVRDSEWLGHVGEEIPKQLAFVCAISARAGNPIQPSTHAESSTGKNYLWGTVLLLLPPEMVIKRSAISDKALFRTEADLSAVLYLQEVAGSEGANFTIRVLQSAQYLEYEATEKMPDGSFKTVVYRKEGPVVVVQTTTAIRLFHENDTRVFPIYLDESIQQTQRIVENAKARAEIGGIPLEEREGVLEVWHDAIRLLKPAEVIIPFARRIEVPVHRVRVRRDINRILDVIRVLAWVHQYTRERDEQGRILATDDDFYTTLELVSDSLERAWKSLTPTEETVMKAIASLPEAKRKNRFTRKDLEVKDYDKRRTQDALKALSESGHLECERKGGPGGYRYTLSRDPQSNKGMGISLRGMLGGDDKDPDTDKQEDPPQSEAIDEDEYDDEGDVPYWAKEENAHHRFWPPEEEEIDYVDKLTERGWYRAEADFAAQDTSEEDSVDEDPVARQLRYKVGIYHGRRSEFFLDYADATPWVGTSEDVLKLKPTSETEEELYSVPWPSSPQEMSERLRRVIPRLQSKPHQFWDPGVYEWCDTAQITNISEEKTRKEAYLHAELWRNEETGEELWALVALKEGWQPPDRAIERAVWEHLTGRRDTEIMPEAFEDDEEGDFMF